MISVSPRNIAALVLAASLAMGVAAHAQDANNAPPPVLDSWASEELQHQDFREEMAQIRRDHEDLEAARDKFKEKCANAAPDQSQACDAERKDLHDQQDKLHERRRALHDKMAAAHRERQEEDKPHRDRPRGERPLGKPSFGKSKGGGKFSKGPAPRGRG